MSVSRPIGPSGPLTQSELEVYRYALHADGDHVVSVASLPKWVRVKLPRESGESSLERLADAGLLQRLEASPGIDSREATRYLLPTTRAGFLRAAQAYLAALPNSCGDDWKQAGSYFLASRYGLKHLTPDLVGEVLSSKGIQNPSIIAPLLGLIQISPSAFLGFVGEWSPVESQSSGGSSGIEAIEHLIYRWVFACINDLAVLRVVPDSGVVMRASVRPEHSLAQRHEPPLLELLFWDGTVIGLEAGFNTEHLYYQGEDDAPDQIAEVERNPENCWVEIWMDHTGPSWGEKGLEAALGYRFENSELLKRVVTESGVPGRSNRRPPLLRRMATLGDAILATYVTTELLRRMKSPTARQIHDTRKQVVNNQNLASIARRLELPVDVLSHFEPRGSPRWAEEEAHMLGDSVEALIGAAYVDGGLKAANTACANLIRRRLEELAPTRLHGFLGENHAENAPPPPENDSDD
jgi:23S rRNA maturation mini-RNase III